MLFKYENKEFKRIIGHVKLIMQVLANIYKV